MSEQQGDGPYLDREGLRMSDPGIDERAAFKTLSARPRLKGLAPREPHFLTDVNHQGSQAGGFRDGRKTLWLMEDQTGMRGATASV